MTKNRNTRVKVPASTMSESVGALSGIPRSNDEMPSNSQERGISDCTTNKADNQLINCHQTKNISFQNVRTLTKKSKRLELANRFNANKLSIMGIADHKIVHEEKYVMEQLNKCILITSSAWTNNNNTPFGGVGLLMDKKLESALSDVDPFNERILCANFNGNPATTIIVHYAPVEGNDEAIDHYINLANAINKAPKHNIIIVIGDCNAHIGKEDARYTYHNETNKNGKLLLELADEANMLITNTHFQKRSGKLWTYISDMSGTKSQIDYILINRKWKNSVKNVEAYSNFGSIGSDHRIITARIKLSLRCERAPPRRKAYDWGVLRSDEELQQRYSVHVQNRYAELCLESESNDVTSTYQNLVIANNEAANELIPTKSRSKRKVTSDDPRIISARDRVNKAFAKYESDPCIDNHDVLKQEKANLKHNYDLAFEEELEHLISKVEDADIRAQHAESWKLINEISGRKSAKAGKIKGKNKEERVQSWYQHFSNLLGKEPVITNDDEEVATVFENLNIESGEFTMNEYQEVKKKLQTGKLPGGDEIPPEVLKYCDLDAIILDYANKLLLNHEKPQQWSDINLLPLPKQGDLGYTNNYRGIALSAVAAKMVNKMLLLRIQPKLDPLLRPNQNGFRPKRSTTAHILALRRLIENVKRKHLKSVILFVDFSKAFDSVHRGKMLKILKAYGIPEQLISAIDKLYEGTRAKVISPDGETDYFNILAGVLQGDTLAPYLFAIVVDYVMRKTTSGREGEFGFTLHQRKSRRCPAVNITDLDFADDIALLSNEIYQAQQLLRELENEAAKVGLHVNAKKTEFMAYNQDLPINVILSINGGDIKQVETFKYLGGWMKDCESDIKIRKALAWAACHKLKSVWSSSLKKSIKTRLFLCTVESVLLYNSETWSLTKQMERSLDGVYTRMLRMALNISWKQHMTNEQLYGRLPKVTSKIAARRLKLAGHLMRHPEEMASSLVLWQPSQGVTNRGRKPVDFIDLLKRDTGLDSVDDLQTTMCDRQVWKGFVNAARSGDRPK